MLPSSEMQFSCYMPDEIARRLGNTPDAVGRRVLEDAAIESYRVGRLSQRQVGAMLGLDYWQTEDFLSQRGVLVNYTKEDLEADRASFERTVGES